MVLDVDISEIASPALGDGLRRQGARRVWCPFERAVRGACEPQSVVLIVGPYHGQSWDSI